MFENVSKFFQKKTPITTKGSFEEKLNALKAFMVKTSTEIFRDGGVAISPMDYIEIYRREINRRVIEMAMGASFSKSADGNWAVKLNGKGPSMEEIAQLGELLHGFISQYENPLLTGYAKAGLIDANGNIVTPNNAGGMEIPDPGDVIIGANPMSARVTFLEKANKKTIEAAILNSSGYMNMYLQVSDLTIMATNAEKFRNSRQLKAMIVAGIVIVVAAGVGAAIYMYHRYKMRRTEEILDRINAEVSCADEIANMEVSCADEIANMEVSCAGTDCDDAPVVAI